MSSMASNAKPVAGQPSLIAPPFTPPSPTAPSSTSDPGGFAHVPALDGLRGLAILLVLFDHLFWANSHTGNRLMDFISALRGASFVGVNLFFALSGFLITGILLDTVTAPRFFRTFYARRTLRIFPLYYGVFFLMLVFTKPLGIVWNGWQFFFLTYTQNLAVWARPAMVMPYLNIHHFWSLQVEEQFYLVWPFVVFYVRDRRMLLRLSVATCVAVLLVRVALVATRPWENPYLVYSPTFSCMDNLLWGCCLATLLRNALKERTLALAPRVFAVCTAIVVAAGIANGGMDFMQTRFIPTLGFSVIGIGSAALIAMALRPSPAQYIFSNSVLRFFGRYSYGIYVFHYSIATMLTSPVRGFVDAQFHNRGLGVLAAAAAGLVASVVAALLSYHLFEVHFLKLKRYFDYGKQVRTKGTAVDGMPGKNAPVSAPSSRV